MRVKYLDSNGVERVQDAAADARQGFSGDSANTNPLQSAGERGPGELLQYAVGVDECEGIVIDGIAAVTMYGGVSALLFALQNDKTGPVDVTIDGSLDQNDVARSRTYTLAAGEVVEFGGEKFDNGLTITASVTRVLTVKGRPQ